MRAGGERCRVWPECFPSPGTRPAVPARRFGPSNKRLLFAGAAIKTTGELVPGRGPDGGNDGRMRS
jgi:hypothetical protein